MAPVISQVMTDSNGLGELADRPVQCSQPPSHPAVSPGKFDPTTSAEDMTMSCRALNPQKRECGPALVKHKATVHWPPVQMTTTAANPTRVRVRSAARATTHTTSACATDSRSDGGFSERGGQSSLGAITHLSCEFCRSKLFAFAQSGVRNEERGEVGVRQLDCGSATAEPTPPN